LIILRLLIFLGVEDPPIRINTLTSPNLLIQQLNRYFGHDDSFTVKLAESMIQRMKFELMHNYESEHTSPAGLAILYQQVKEGGIPPKMIDLMKKESADTKGNSVLLKEAKECFFKYVDVGKDNINFSTFYEAYLRPFLGCFSCPRTRFVLDAIDFNDDQDIEWKEWRFWCLWALRNHSDYIVNVDDLHSYVLRYAILPLSLCAEKVNSKNPKDILERHYTLTSIGSLDFLSSGCRSFLSTSRSIPVLSRTTSKNSKRKLDRSRDFLSSGSISFLSNSSSDVGRPRCGSTSFMSTGEDSLNVQIINCAN